MTLVDGRAGDGGLVRVPADWQPPEAAPLPAVLAEARLLTDSGDVVPLHIQALAGDVHAIEGTLETSRFLCLSLPLGPADHLVGGGAQFCSLDLRGRVIDGWISDAASQQTYFHAPVVLCSAGWMLVVDTTARYAMDCGVSDPSRLAFTVPGGSLRAVLVSGTPQRCISVVTSLTGRAAMPPPWAFGVWHNVRSGVDAVERAAQRLREARIPGSALWVDDHYCAELNDGDGWPGNYPLARYGAVDEMRGLVSRLHALGFKALTYVNPMVYRDTPWYREALSRGLVVRDASGGPLHLRFFTPLHAREGIVDFEEDVAALLDFTNPETVEAWRANVRRLLCDVGWDGWMEDFGEQVPPDALLHDGSSGALAHNRFALEYHAATAAERVECKPDSVVMARSGWLGGQALANAYWGGDQLCEWSADFGIASVIPAGLSAGLIGVGTWGCDISGLFALPEKPLATGAGDRELWMRWCQLGAMTPIMRTHLGFKPEPTPPLDMWHDEEMTECFRRAATLHMRLFPYLWACARECADTGMPIMRALLLEFPDDPQCWTIADQFMLGPSLLVAPVLERGARRRRVYLPKGTWFEVGDAAGLRGPLLGPGWVEVEAPLDRVPLFQRAGTIVPLLAETPQTLAEERFARGGYDLELWVAPLSGDGASVLALPDGTRLALRGARLDVSGPERSYLVKAHGMFLGLARGTALDFELSPAVVAVERGEAASVDRGRAVIEVARREESARGVHHDDAVSPQPPRPMQPFTVRARAESSLDVAAMRVHWRHDGAAVAAVTEMQPVSPVPQVPPVPRSDGGGAAAATGAAAEPPGRPLVSDGLAPVGASEAAAAGGGDESDDAWWEAALPALPDGTTVRYSIEAVRRDGTSVWAEDAGPGLEFPDPEVVFARPPAREFRTVVGEPSVPRWFREATVYHLLVDRFGAGGGASLPHDGDVRFLQFAGGTLRGITEHLDHLSDLGVDCLLLSPITPGEMHVTYDAKDLRSVDPRFGSLDDVRTLLREAHGRGMRVLLDSETSYLGVRHPAAVHARTHADSPYRDWFHWHRWPDRWYSWFSGRIFASLDHTNPAVRRELLDAARFWLDLGVDGFRLDSAAATPLEFWSEFGETVRTARPDAVTLGEAFGTTASLRRYMGRLTGVFDFHLSHLLRSGLGTATAPLTDLDALMRTRTAEQADENGGLARALFVENHDMPRMSSLAPSRSHLLAALTALLTLGPTPILYYGTEVGVPQGPTPSIDPDARLPMRWGTAQDSHLHAEIRRLVHLRRDTPALRSATWRSLLATPDTWAYQRGSAGDSVCVVLHRGDAPATVDIPVADIWPDGTALRDLLGTVADTPVADGRARLALPDCGAVVLAPR